MAACLLGAPVVMAGEGEAPAAAAAPADPAQELLAGAAEAARLGRTREALRGYGAVARRFPGSQASGEALLAIGDHHAASGDLTRARAAYEGAQRTAPGQVRAAERLAALAAALRQELERLERGGARHALR
jgi:TolA-binding protein